MEEELGMRYWIHEGHEGHEGHEVNHLDHDLDRKINGLEKDSRNRASQCYAGQEDRKVTPRGGELDNGGLVFQPAL